VGSKTGGDQSYSKNCKKGGRPTQRLPTARPPSTLAFRNHLLKDLSHPVCVFALACNRPFNQRKFSVQMCVYIPNLASQTRRRYAVEPAGVQQRNMSISWQSSSDPEQSRTFKRAKLSARTTSTPKGHWEIRETRADGSLEPGGLWQLDSCSVDSRQFLARDTRCLRHL